MVTVLAANYNYILNITEQSSKILRLTRTVEIGWEPLEEGWAKLNVDGSVLQPGSRGASGGIIRDSRGRFLAGFSMNIGKCTITIAELWGFFVGMKLAVEMSIPYLMVESDSSCAVHLLQSAVVENHVGASLVRSIKELMTRPHRVVIRHVFREANQCADVLAKHGQVIEKGIKWFEKAPAMVVPLVCADERGMKFSRKSVA
ncbi:hypothetical protein HN873_007945 [Arachis hypogaea]